MKLDALTRAPGVTLGTGNLSGKGVYAAREFCAGEIVIKYNLKALTDEEYASLAGSERCFTHLHDGTWYLYSEPERYVNCAPNPNTCQDLVRECDFALRDIHAGESITTDPKRDDVA